MIPLRIYITDSRVEAYYEGCSCCSSDRRASLGDIKALMDNLDKQKSQLAMLLELLEDYGEAQVVCWHKEYENLESLNRVVLAAQEYEKNPNIQGTYYKDAYEQFAENVAGLRKATKKYKKTPALFRKYIMEIQK